MTIDIQLELSGDKAAHSTPRINIARSTAQIFGPFNVPTTDGDDAGRDKAKKQQLAQCTPPETGAGIDVGSAKDERIEMEQEPPPEVDFIGTTAKVEMDVQKAEAWLDRHGHPQEKSIRKSLRLIRESVLRDGKRMPKSKAKSIWTHPLAGNGHYLQFLISFEQRKENNAAHNPVVSILALSSDLKLNPNFRQSPTLNTTMGLRTWPDVDFAPWVVPDATTRAAIVNSVNRPGFMDPMGSFTAVEHVSRAYASIYHARAQEIQAGTRVTTQAKSEAQARARAKAKLRPSLVEVSELM
ncbi:hypothetical protein HK102_013381 [Quaeritorhiza haematococci]|nr:hypothetical protein HK102_013381 [Quaeritorhiza haematococci]